MRRAAVGAGAGIVGSYLALQALGRGWGASSAERRGPLVGDELVAAPHLRTTHAITIAAPPREVWPWIVQMGYHRGGWYTYPWVDRLLHVSNPSVDRVIPELQDVHVGDRIPDGPPDTAWYDVVEIDPPRHLVLRSTTHLPVQWRTNPRLHAWIDWTWVFALEEPVPGATRLVLRMRGRCGPRWLRLLFRAAIVPADFVMARSMLRGIRARAEALSLSILPAGRLRSDGSAERRPILEVLP